VYRVQLKYIEGNYGQRVTVMLSMILYNILSEQVV